MLRIVSILFLGITLAACAQTDNSSGEREQIMEQLDPNRENKIQNTSNANNKLGYVNYTRDQLNQDTESDHFVTIDRTQMADMIARMILRNEGFNRVATLVTDKEVLIAFERDEEFEANKAADIASRTASSIMPGLYDVYVTDNKNLIPDIQSLHNSSSTNKNYQNTIDQIITQMKKSPQGKNNRQDMVD